MRRGTLVGLATLVVLLGAFWLFGDRDRGEGAGAGAHARLIDSSAFDRSAVQRITIARAGVPPFSLDRQAPGQEPAWRESPGDLAADAPAVEDLLSALDLAETTRTADVSPAAAGLAPPRVTIALGGPRRSGHARARAARRRRPRGVRARRRRAGDPRGARAPQRAGRSRALGVSGSAARPAPGRGDHGDRLARPKNRQRAPIAARRRPLADRRATAGRARANDGGPPPSSRPSRHAARHPAAPARLGLANRGRGQGRLDGSPGAAGRSLRRAGRSARRARGAGQRRRSLCGVRGAGRALARPGGRVRPGSAPRRRAPRDGDPGRGRGKGRRDGGCCSPERSAAPGGSKPRRLAIPPIQKRSATGWRRSGGGGASAAGGLSGPRAPPDARWPRA